MKKDNHFLMFKTNCDLCVSHELNNMVRLISKVPQLETFVVGRYSSYRELRLLIKAHGLNSDLFLPIDSMLTWSLTSLIAPYALLVSPNGDVKSGLITQKEIPEYSIKWFTEIENWFLKNNEFTNE